MIIIDESTDLIIMCDENLGYVVIIDADDILIDE